MSEMNAPLSGVRVVDFTRVLAGPHCTKALRDLGADVIKIEPPSGDIGRIGVPLIDSMSLYFVQQNAGKRNVSIDLNWPEGREIVAELCRGADVVVENFRPGTLARFGLDHAEICKTNPRVVYVSMSGYGQTGPWRNRPAFAPTVQAETGLTAINAEHYGDALVEARNDSCSHADVYTGLQGVIAVLAALQQRERTGRGQHVDVSMAATMLSVNERAGAQMSGLDTQGEPVALSAPESPIFELPGGRKLTIASSPVFTPTFLSYCAMMRRIDLMSRPEYATPQLRAANCKSLLAEIRAWILTFSDLDELQAQVSEAGLAIGEVRTVAEFSESEWAAHWGAVVEVDDRSGGKVRMPGSPWRFSDSTLPAPGVPRFQGENNEEVLRDLGVDAAQIRALQARGVLRAARGSVGTYD